MSSASSSPPRIVPVKFRRKSSSASAHAASDDFAEFRRYPDTPPSSLSPTQIQFTRHPISEQYGERNRARPCDMDYHWLHHSQHLDLYDPTPLPSLTSRFSRSSCDGDPRAFRPFNESISMSSDFFSEGDSAIDDQDEEYDLEDMDIPVRGSYFQVSEERGRWKSSPIIPRTRTQMFASSPIRGGSGNDALPVHPRSRRESACSIACSELSTPSFTGKQEETDDLRFSSPLPPSSPPTSPMSFAPSLPEDYLVDDHEPLDSTPLLPNQPRLNTPEPLPRDHPPRLQSPNVIQSCSVSASSNGVNSKCSSPFDGCPDPNTRTSDPDPTFVIAEQVTNPVSSSTAMIPSPENSTAVIFRDCDDIASVSSLPPIKTRSPVLSVTVPGAESSPLKNILQPSNVNQDTTQIPAEVDSSTSKKSNTKVVRTRSENKKSSRTRGEGHPSDRPRKKCRLSVSEDAHQGSQLGKPSRRAKNRLSSSRREKSPHRTTTGGHPPPTDSHEEHRVASPPSPCAQLAPDATSSVAPSSQQCSTAEHGELTGLLVETLATSRATSMDTATLYLVLTRSHPRFAAQYEKQALVQLIGSALETGRAQCGMFERVIASGEGAVDGMTKPVAEGEGRWFYVAAKDEDRERASLVSALMPRQKRSETMKYKQYYWRPLDRISKWDPEDAL